MQKSIRAKALILGLCLIVTPVLAFVPEKNEDQHSNRAVSHTQSYQSDEVRYEMTAEQKTAVLAAEKEKIQIERHSRLGLPISVRGHDLGLFGEYSRGNRLSVQNGGRTAADAVAVVDNLSGIYDVRDAKNEFTVGRIKEDGLGCRHTRLEQKHNGLRVVGGQLIVHFNSLGKAYEVNGRYIPRVDVDQTAGIDAAQALSSAQEDLTGKGHAEAFVANEPELVVFAWDAKPELAYELTLAYENPDGTDPGRWRYWVAATDGRILRCFNDIKKINPPSENGQATQVTGNILSGEGGGNINLTGWRENTGIYYVYNKSSYWYIYNVAAGGYPDNNTYAYRPASDWGTSDQAEISAGRNFDLIQNYYRSVFNRSSYDDQNVYACANVHEGINYVNAYWDGSDFHFGDGDGRKANALCVLDICGHEYTHAVIEHTANLHYYGESGALNESFADIFGTCIEFYSQPDGRSYYPNKAPGTADWLGGEDSWLEPTALRDLRNPANTATVGAGNEQPTRYHGTYWYYGSADYGGVHYNNSVQNFFFYLLCEGGQGNNDGVPYNVSGIGIANAERIAYRALTVYCGRYTTYEDVRCAWLSAANDLTPAWGSSVQAAWNAVYSEPLNAPMGVSASDWTYVDKVRVVWQIICPATSYEVWRSSDNNSANAVRIADIAGTTYDDFSATAGLPCYYWVKAKNDSSTTGFSEYDEGGRIIIGHSPSVPLGVRASDRCPVVRVVWQMASMATSYEVWRGPDNNSANAVKIADTTGIMYTDFSAMAGIRYYYFVKAKNNNGTSAFSVPDSGMHIKFDMDGGGDHSVAQVDGHVWAWGRNDYGQLGDGTTVDRLTPVQVPLLSDVVQVSASMDHTMALKSDGTVWGWGRNDCGQLGDGTSDGLDAKRLTPVQVPLLSDVVQVSASVYNTMALKSDGTVWGWGYNGYGQLGKNIGDLMLNPTQIPELSNIVMVSAGVERTMFLKSDGTVWLLGLKNGYFLAHTGILVRTPLQILSHVISISTMNKHLLALKADGTVWAWGDNYHGALGDGTTESRWTTPVQVSGLSDIVMINTGFFHSHALKSDGTMWSWGVPVGGDWSQPYLTPVQEELSGILSITAGGGHVMALKSDGTLWAWGSNDGQLGDGTTTTRLVPVRVQLPALLPPAEVSASDGAYTDKVQVTWKAVSDADYYEVWRNTENNADTASKIGTSGSAAYDDLTATAGVLYYYWVKAVNAAGTSAFSASDSGYTSAPGTLQFSSSAYSVNENGKSVTLTVTRTGGSNGAVSVVYMATNGVTAVPVVDFTPTGGSLRWANGETGGKTFSVAIVDDTLYEGNETFKAMLSDARGARMGSPSSATVTIVDNDQPSPGTLQFISSAYSVNENGGSVTLRVMRTGGCNGAASVGYMATNGITAKPGVDFTPTGGSLRWLNGEMSSKTFSVPIIDDTLYEGNETFEVMLCYPSGAALGSPSSAAVTIIDNEQSPTNPPANPPSAPTGVSASDGNYTDKVRVTWNAVANASRYQVIRFLSGLGYNYFDVSGSQTQYDDKNASVGVVYTYWVRTVNSNGMSGFSLSDIGYRGSQGPTNPPVPPPAPTGAKASDGNYTDKVRVTWNATTTANAYAVYRATVNNTVSASMLSTNAATTFDDTTATAGITYYYWVKAINGAGMSAFSASDSGYRQADGPVVPTNTVPTNIVIETHVWIGNGHQTLSGNSQDEVPSLTGSEMLSVSIGLDTTCYAPADWWIVVDTPFGMFVYQPMMGKWVPYKSDEQQASYQGNLSSIIAPMEVFRINTDWLPEGRYVFHFGVDMVPNGIVDQDALHVSSATVDVQ